jgi:hypothetical protein
MCRRLLTCVAVMCAGTATVAACTCVPFPSAREAMASSALVFRGSVTNVETLPSHPKMRGRQRYAVTFLVNEYWRAATPAQTVTLYDLDPGTDCMGAGFQKGRTYLVFAAADKARDYQLDDPDSFLVGWTDVLPPGTPMFQPLVACMPGGDTSRPEVRKHLRQLGRGTSPKLK